MSSTSAAACRLPDRYAVVRHLRSGGMASLWQAHDRALDRDVAVKVLADHLSRDAAARSRFEREARAVARLSSHRNVVTIYDVGDCDGVAYLVMELMPGGSLADRLAAGGPVPTEQTLAWLADAADALDAAHAAGIVHRDVKPGNMLLDARGRLSLADFGIARLARDDQLTRTGEILGTTGYLAPEQALGRPATDASDRYALAVVAYEILTGRRPFASGVAAAEARAHVEDEVPPASAHNPALGRWADSVLRRGMAKRPDLRWPTARSFVDALQRTLAEAPARDVHAAAGGDTRTVPATTAVARRPAMRRPSVDVRAMPPVPPTRSVRARPHPARRLVPAAILLGLVAALAVPLALSGGGDGGGAPQTTTSGGSRDGTSARTTAPATGTASTPPAETTTTAPPPKSQRSSGRPATRGPSPRAAPQAFRVQQVAGFRARQAGDLAEAVRLDRRVVEACGPDGPLDPCGYALFELGAALRRAGQRAEAATVLRQRLERYGDNPTGEVARELALAER